MSNMHSATVIPLDTARDRSRRVARAVDARRRLHEPGDRRARIRPEGRAWVNGYELGGTRDALAHLGESFD